MPITYFKLTVQRRTIFVGTRQNHRKRWIITLKRTGPIVSAMLINSKDDRDMIIISEKGQTIRFSSKTIPSLSRATQGVRVMRFKAEKDSVSSVTLI